MGAPPGGAFQHRGVVVTPDRSDPRTWWYLPAGPEPERGPSGRPTATLVRAGELGMLQLGTRLDPQPPVLEDVRRQITERHPERAGVPVRLVPAVTAVASVELLLADDGGWSELARTTGSGYPPYTAVFSASLRGPQLARVATAFEGGTGQLQVRYHAIVDGRGRMMAADVATWFGAGGVERHTVGTGPAPPAGGPPPPEARP